MSEKWIIKTTIGSPRYVDGAYNSTADINNAKIFHSEALAKQVAETLKTPNQVISMASIEITNVEKESHVNTVNSLKVPVPDFFEQTYQMSLEDMVALLQVECLVDVFTPVDNITGANQMTGSGIYDLEAENGAFIGARYEFSFDQILSDDDIKRFHTVDSLIEGWKSGAYRVKRNGFTSYGHLVLIRDMTN